MNDKYKPTKIDEIIGNKASILELSKWLNIWNETQVLKSVFIYGPNGVGKTLTVDILLKEKYNMIEINPEQVPWVYERIWELVFTQIHP